MSWSFNSFLDYKGRDVDMAQLILAPDTKSAIRGMPRLIGKTIQHARSNSRKPTEETFQAAASYVLGSAMQEKTTFATIQLARIAREHWLQHLADEDNVKVLASPATILIARVLRQARMFFKANNAFGWSASSIYSPRQRIIADRDTTSLHHTQFNIMGLPGKTTLGILGIRASHAMLLERGLAFHGTRMVVGAQDFKREFRVYLARLTPTIRVGNEIKGGVLDIYAENMPLEKLTPIPVRRVLQ